VVGRTEAAVPAEKQRMERIKFYTGCLPSMLRGFDNGHCQVHHVLDGVSEWHHEGHTHPGRDPRYMEWRFGPSMARNPRAYHEAFGSEAQLLNLQDFALEIFKAIGWPQFAMPREVSDQLRKFHREQRAFG